MPKRRRKRKSKRRRKRIKKRKLVKTPIYEQYYQYMHGNISYAEMMNSWDPILKHQKKMSQRKKILVCLLEKKPKVGRKSPPFSATCFPIGFKLPTYDPFTVWEIKKSGKTQVWRRVGEPKYIETSEEGIESFILPKSGKFKKVATLPLKEGKLSVGEHMYRMFKVKKGDYIVYVGMYSLLIAPKGVSMKDIKKATWRYAGYGVGVDTGSIGFQNGKVVEDINKLVEYKQGRSVFGEHGDIKIIGDVAIDDMLARNRYDLSIVKGDDIIKSRRKEEEEKVENYIRKNKLEKTVVGVYSENGIGDGFFPVFYDKNMYIICGRGILDFIDSLREFPRIEEEWT